jgi:lipid-binding SYLF domain-containing protein
MTKKAPIFSTLFAAAAILATSIIGSSALAAGDPGLDARAADTLQKFRKHEPDAKAVIKKAAGVLVFSGIIKGAFLFGAEAGDGALQVSGKSIAYYNFAAASFGLQIGGQSKALVVIFRDKAALDRFQNASGFELGIDGQVAFFNKGAGDTLTTITNNTPLVFYVFDNTGLLADVSMKGGKFTKLDR